MCVCVKLRQKECGIEEALKALEVGDLAVLVHPGQGKPHCTRAGQS